MTDHGTRYGFKSGCTCRPCKSWDLTHRRKLAYNRAVGNGQYAPAGPVRAHVLALIEQGLGTPQIAKLAGVERSSLSNLLYGRPSRGLRPPQRIVRSNAEKLLRVQPVLADGARVMQVGAQRRAQALVCQGWSLQEIARRAGIAGSMLRQLVYDGVVWKATADKVSAVFAELWDQVPDRSTPRRRAAVTQARLLGERHGWFPAMAWDDIDDPAAVPVVGEQVRSFGRIDVSEVEWLRSFGTSDELIAAQLGVTVSGLRKSLWKQAAA